MSPSSYVPYTGVLKKNQSPANYNTKGKKKYDCKLLIEDL